MNEKEMNVNLRDALINQVNKHLSDAAALFDLLHFLDDKKDSRLYGGLARFYRSGNEI